MFLLSRFLVSAMGTGKAVVVEIEVARTECPFQAPMSGKGPLIAIAEAETCAPALSPFPFKIKYLHVGEVIGNERNVKADEMFVERFAKPIAKLRMHPQVLQGFSVRTILLFVRKRIKTGLNVQCPFFCKKKFYSCIKGDFTPPIQ